MSLVLIRVSNLYTNHLWTTSKLICLRYSFLIKTNRENAALKTRARQITSCAKLQYPIEPKPSLEDGFWKKTSSKWKWFFSDQYKVSLACMCLYEGCVDKVNAKLFIEHFQLPDTFVSWFLITELHVWMCLVRAMREGKEGEFARKEVMTHMWKDVEERVKKLGEINSKVKKDGLQLLSDQFRTALCAYDEGLLSNDRVLAAAVWRTLFCYNCQDPNHLEVLVHYIRKNVHELDQMDHFQVLYDGKMEWIPLDVFLK